MKAPAKKVTSYYVTEKREMSETEKTFLKYEELQKQYDECNARMKKNLEECRKALDEKNKILSQGLFEWLFKINT